MYEQLIQPNLSIVGQDGDCLIYVREVFGVAAEYLTAAVAWQNAQYQHLGIPPSDIAVPIWFSWETEGHVAVWDNGTVYSTTAKGDMTFASIQELTDFIGEGIEYLGWSEDINSVRVVEEQIMPGVTIQGAPTSTGDPSTRIDIFARGSDNNLWQKYFDAGGWHDWAQVGSGIASDPTVPAPYNTSAGRLDVFFTGVAGDLVHTWCLQGKWQPNESLGKPT